MEKCVEISDLTTSYGKKRGIVNVNLTINKGEIFGFIGPNGAGKSTTIKTILGFLFPSNGNVKVFGMNCNKSIEKIKEKIGYLPSEVNYYDEMTVEQLLEYSSKFYKKNCKERMKELINRFDVDVNKKVNELSLGNKKKVAIIQALLHEPELLILDEPTNGLDPLMQNIFFETIKEENKKGTTIFFSSHILSDVQRVCDRVAIIKEGEIIKVQDIDEISGMNHLKIKIQAVSNQEISKRITEELKVEVEEEEKYIQFYYNNDINSLLHILSEYEVRNLLITELSLEESFSHYYR